MKTWKILTGLALGAGIYYLYNTDKGEELREDIADSLKDLKKKMDKMAGKAGAELADVQKMMSKQIEGVSEDARKKIMDILEDSADQVKKSKNTVNRMMA